MCVGTVPIATRVGSVPDVIDHGVNGLLLESASPDVIAAALTDVLGDVDLERRLRMGALRARERFDYASATRVWAQLIDAMRVA
jgi:glycosyltransferase involved in cell wall biosynthesis